MSECNYKQGTLVVHTKRPEWGIGTIMSASGDKAQVEFALGNDDNTRKALKNMILSMAPLEIVGHADGNVSTKVSMSDSTYEYALAEFLKHFPQGFRDPRYIGDGKGGERQYKVEAHELFHELLGDGKVQRFLDDGNVQEVVQCLLQVVSKVNLLSPYESMALRDALIQAEGGEEEFCQSLMNVLSCDTIEESVCKRYFDALCNLSANEGKARVATWPVATIIPFLAQPDRHMFLKPKVTLLAADRLGFPLYYSPQPNWQTYRQLRKMCEQLTERLHSWGVQDFIDIQSFIWVTAMYGPGEMVEDN